MAELAGCLDLARAAAAVTFSLSLPFLPLTSSAVLGVSVALLFYYLICLFLCFCNVCVSILFMKEEQREDLVLPVYFMLFLRCSSFSFCYGTAILCFMALMCCPRVGFSVMFL